MAAPGTALSVLMPPSEEPASEYIMLEPEAHDGPDVAEDDEGGITYTFGEGDDQPEHEPTGEFYDNLADIIPPLVTDRIVQDLLRLIEEDKKAREPRDKQYEEGIKRTGLSKDAPGGAEFEGASKVAHPMLTQACIDFEARVIKEIWPPNGPVVRPKILGEANHEKTQKADRKTAYMNYQLTTIIKEGRAVMESTMSQVPLGGAQYIKLWHDASRKRPFMQFIPIDKTILPANAASWASSHRRTFADNVTNVEFGMRVNSGLYRAGAEKFSAPSSAPDTTKAEAASKKVEGVEPSSSGINQDADREIYETMTYLEVTDEMSQYLGDVEETGQLYPYLITMDVTNRTMLAMYRDWEPDDEAHEPIDHLFEFPCIPWRGAQSIGIAHVIGGLTAAATGALRALLDSAMIANLQGGIYLKGSGKSGGDLQAKPGDWTEVDAGLEAQDIRQRFMAYSTKEPSAVLFQLLGALVDAGTGAVRTSMDQEAIDTNANTPVGTQLSRVEEGLAVFSAIHARIHTAFDRLLAGLHRINRMYLPEALYLTIDGKEVFIKRADFEGPPDVQPVSEPTIVSNQQRMAQIMSVEQSAVALASLPQFANLYDMRAIQKRKLKLWNVTDSEELLPEPPKPVELNAVNENLAMALAKPVTVFPEQDHLAHLQAHLDFGKSPVLGGNPIIATKFLPTFLQHCSEHMLYFYVQTIHGMVSEAAGTDASQLLSKDPDIKKALDRVLAMASMQAVPMTEETFGGAMEVLQKGMQTLKSLMPPAPVDPGAAAVQAAAAETERKKADDRRKAVLDTAKLSTSDKQAAAKNVIAMKKIESDRDKAEMTARAKLTESIMDNQTARDIESARIAAGAAGSGGHLKDGDSISQ